MINSKVIDGPGGVPSWYEDVSPMNTLKREIIMAAANTHLNPLAIRIAKAAGSTRSAETSSTPIIGIMTEIASPVTMLNDIDRRFVLIPDVFAVASSR